MNNKESISKISATPTARSASVISRSSAAAIPAGTSLEVSSLRSNWTDRHLAVLFFDIRQFTAFSEAAPAGAPETLLEDFHYAVTLELERHGATLDHRAGDGLMAYFVASASDLDRLSRSNTVRKAARMALRIRDAVEPIFEPWENQGHSLGLGASLAWGAGRLGYLGGGATKSHVATGRTVNLGARLCDFARGGQILVNAGAARELSEYATLSGVSWIALRGLGKRIPTRNLRGLIRSRETPAQSSLPSAVVRLEDRGSNVTRIRFRTEELRNTLGSTRLVL